ncbi:unnamed protein product, partial [Ectocarpus sp. 4 AP-2014]
RSRGKFERIRRKLFLRARFRSFRSRVALAAPGTRATSCLLLLREEFFTKVCNEDWAARGLGERRQSLGLHAASSILPSVSTFAHRRRASSQVARTRHNCQSLHIVSPKPKNN